MFILVWTTMQYVNVLHINVSNGRITSHCTHTDQCMCMCRHDARMDILISDWIYHQDLINKLNLNISKLICHSLLYLKWFSCLSSSFRFSHLNSPLSASTDHGIHLCWLDYWGNTEEDAKVYILFILCLWYNS